MVSRNAPFPLYRVFGPHLCVYGLANSSCNNHHRCYGCYYGAKKIAVSDEDDPMYSGHTPKWFFPLMVIHMNTIIWNVDFWARKRKKAKKESSSKEDAKG